MSTMIQKFYMSRFGVGLATSLAAKLEPGVAYRFSRAASRLLASQHRLPVVRAVRANLWVITRGHLNPEQLDKYVENVFFSRFQSIYDLHHYLSDNEALRRMVRFTASMERILQRLKEAREGLMVVIPHLGNFDFVGKAVINRGHSFQALTFPRPSSGYLQENAIRSELGMEITPISRDALRQAENRLSAGGAVMTGLDRPLANARYRPRFFGRPAPMPVLHVRLAIKTGVPIVVVGNTKQEDGSYKIFASEPIRMQRHSNRTKELVSNAETVLNVASEFIRQTPGQWGMFYPVWPEVFENMGQ
jgi:phosphatidylinositol dimannoside acyltransferase